jgi:glucose-6-phosphate 1-epimerase
MANIAVPDDLKRFEIPGRVALLEGNGELPKIEVTTDWSNAEIYLQGAQVTDFQKKGEAPILFTSQFSRFAAGQPIRGGIPIVFPWFGPREGEPMHGFARQAAWNLHEVVAVPEGGVSLRFSLPETADSSIWPPFSAYYVVTVTDKLDLELIVTNCAADEPFSFEACLHSYFMVSDISLVSILGLKGAAYLDKVENFAPKTETNEALRIAGEVDRVYLDTPGRAEIVDPKLGRRIFIEKAGCASTVIWNPWIGKSKQMPDIGNDEYRQMVCVETGNVAQNEIALAPGKSSVMRVTIGSVGL